MKYLIVLSCFFITIVSGSELDTTIANVTQIVDNQETTSYEMSQGKPLIKMRFNLTDLQKALNKVNHVEITETPTTMKPLPTCETVKCDVNFFCLDGKCMGPMKPIYCNRLHCNDGYTCLDNPTRCVEIKKTTS